MTAAPFEGDWDHIIVGAGSAGCVLANRLSADPHRRVLFPEAGGQARHPYLQVPAGFTLPACYRAGLGHLEPQATLNGDAAREINPFSQVHPSRLCRRGVPQSRSAAGFRHCFGSGADSPGTYSAANPVASTRSAHRPRSERPRRSSFSGVDASGSIVDVVRGSGGKVRAIASELR
ncbi:hypothetical protein E2C06_21865 [Dankookia rubra]|uniref:Uncharacterized protein n=1 Tax=Dankookia rubra TaxID=1442381 RepID=A0A4R5QCJ3_9PROT|nr:hypothetical protein E2C06_21865 [Dankookia rubra]